MIGVAAPSQQQTPLNWAYPPCPNRYNLQVRLTGYVNQIYVQAMSPGDVQPAIAQITESLPAATAFAPATSMTSQCATWVRSRKLRKGRAATWPSCSRPWHRSRGSSVASVSRILLVSMTQRTREIGLRMAIGGARMCFQFLAEAVFLSLSGGVPGIVVGILFSIAISLVTGWPAPISVAAIVGGFVFSAAGGIFFGFYPARKAASLDPIEAFRYE